MNVTEKEDDAYQAGGTSPVSGVTHLFPSEEDGVVEPAISLCGAVGSYGTFRSITEVPQESVCKNCQRVLQQREYDEEHDV